MRPWGAELIPIALASMILAVAYNPLFALVFTFGSSLLASLALGVGPRLFHHADGRDRLPASCCSARSGRGPSRSRSASRRRSATRCSRPPSGFWQDQPIGADRHRLRPPGRLGPADRLPARRQPAVRRVGLRHRHRHQPAGTGRRQPPAAPGARPPGTRHAQPLDHRRHDRRGRRREDRGRRPCWSGSAPISTTSARCSSRTTSSRTRSPAASTGTPTSPRR